MGKMQMDYDSTRRFFIFLEFVGWISFAIGILIAFVSITSRIGPVSAESSAFYSWTIRIFPGILISIGSLILVAIAKFGAMSVTALARNVISAPDEIQPIETAPAILKPESE